MLTKRKLGRGGFAEVTLGYVTSQLLPSAVKVVTATTTKGRAAFAEEVRILCSVSPHLNIVGVLHSNATAWSPLLCMELAKESLADCVERQVRKDSIL